MHRLKHYVGAYLAMLGRLDVLAFTAGVGENNPALRAAVVEGLDGLGLAVDPARNEARLPGGPGDLPRRLAGHGRGRARPTRSWPSPARPPQLLAAQTD